LQRGGGLDWRTTNAAAISDERNRDQNEHHHEDDPLFVLGELENSEEPLHLANSVMLSEAKHLWLLLGWRLQVI
jgi:hypothetical protein